METPSEEDIQAHLDGLNRCTNTPASGRESADAKALGTANYLKWFKEHHILIQIDPKTHQWVVRT